MASLEPPVKNHTSLQKAHPRRPSWPRSGNACQICHKKKIKCDLSENRFPCTNCSVSDNPCKPHERKRKRYALSLSPTRTLGQSYQQRPEGRQRQLPPGGEPRQTQLVALSPNDAFSEETNPNPNVPDAAESYLGRSEYLPSGIPFSEANAEYGRSNTTLSGVNLKILQLQKAFDVPSKSVSASLIDNFMTFCYPWMPIVERPWLEEIDGIKPSTLLLQAVFLAGSRVSSGSLLYASSEEFYQRAKALFYCGHEKNMLITIIAVCLLHWWGPASPGENSADGSFFWISVGVRFAYQIGLHKEPSGGRHAALRRRVWWTLVARDSMVSASLGRPRAICLEDSDMSPPSVEDFPVQTPAARLYVPYVTISRLMGDITECRLREKLSRAKREEFENALYRWVKDLPPEFRLFQSNPERSLAAYNFEARQLLIHYFVNLVILFGSRHPKREPPAASILASSFICGILEGFLARDELRYLRVNFAFMSLSAGLCQLTAYRYDALRGAGERGVGIIKLSLQELSKKWRSADTALKSLVEVSELVLQQQPSESPNPTLAAAEFPFFEDFGPDLCEEWIILLGQRGPQNTIISTGRQQDPTMVTGQADVHAQTIPRDATGSADPLSLPDVSLFPPFGPEYQALEELNNSDALGLLPGWGQAGTWLLNDMNVESWL